MAANLGRCPRLGYCGPSARCRWSGFLRWGGLQLEFEGVLGEGFDGGDRGWGGGGCGLVAGLEEDGWVGAERVDGEREFAARLLELWGEASEADEPGAANSRS